MGDWSCNATTQSLNIDFIGYLYIEIAYLFEITNINIIISYNKNILKHKNHPLWVTF